jgi:hypothetical protein
MIPPNEPLSTSILAIMYFGDIVFSVSVDRSPLPHGLNRFYIDWHHHRHRRRYHAGPAARPHSLVDPESAGVDPVCGGVSGNLFLHHERHQPPQVDDLGRRPRFVGLRCGRLPHRAAVRFSLNHRSVYGHGDGNRGRLHSGCDHQHPANDRVRTAIRHGRAAWFPELRRPASPRNVGNACGAGVLSGGFRAAGFVNHLQYPDGAAGRVRPVGQG